VTGRRERVRAIVASTEVTHAAMGFPIRAQQWKPIRRLRLQSVLGSVLMLTALPGLPVTVWAGSKQTNLQTATPQSAEAPNAEFDAYILGAGDGLTLNFLSGGNASLGGSFQLLNDGSTSLPMIGSVVLEGLTVNQATRWLTSLYRRYLREPDLILRVTQPRPMQISVIGQVENPGFYVLNPGAEGSSVEGKAAGIPGLPTVVSAIQKAGGINLNANLRDVRLQRRLPGDKTQLRETQLDLVALLQKGDKRQNPFLFDGDTIVLGRAPAPPPDEVLELAAANLSPQSISVNMVGEVKSPGQLKLRAGTPLMQALLAAGGPTPYRANRNNVELVRINRDGTATLRRYSVDYRQGVSGPRNPPLRDGDSIIVNRSVLATGSDTLNAVTQPLTGLVNILALVEILRNNDNNN
jgi:polysaccharide export outer membrane protein